MVDKALSDHCLIHVEIELQVKRKQKILTRCRNLKQIDIPTLKTELKELELFRFAPRSIDEHVNLFESTLSHILDRHAPEVEKVISIRPDSPWYNDEVHLAKIRKRQAER